MKYLKKYEFVNNNIMSTGEKIDKNTIYLHDYYQTGKRYIDVGKISKSKSKLTKNLDIFSGYRLFPKDEKNDVVWKILYEVSLYDTRKANKEEINFYNLLNKKDKFNL